MQRYIYQCRDCDDEFEIEYGQCPSCDSMGSMVRVKTRMREAKESTQSHVAKVTPVAESGKKSRPRLVTEFEEYDRVLGGGSVLGFVQLWSGPPGIGKSTLFTQLCGFVAQQGNTSLFVCGEESRTQLARRAKRLGVLHEKFLATEDREVETLKKTIAKHRPAFVVVDSIQTVYCEDTPGEPGNLKQIHESARRLQRAAKRHKCVMVLLSQVNKDDGVAGGRGWQHLVDGIFHVEGDPGKPHRLLRSSKNREGSTAEVGVLEMGSRGLAPVEDLDDLYLQGQVEPVEGLILTLVPVGYRSAPVGVQALVRPSDGDKGRRFVSGFSRNRLEILLATLRHRIKGAPDLSQWDIFLDVTGDVELGKKADLAVVLALLGSAFHVPTSHWCALGEVTLAGYTASAATEQQRAEAERRGLRCIMPPKGSSLQDLLCELFGSKL